MIVAVPAFVLPPKISHALAVTAVTVGVAGLGFFISWLLFRAGRLKFERRRREAATPSVVAKPRVYAPADEPIFYNANGLFPVKSRFLQLIGAGRISDGSLNAARRLGLLRTGWNSFGQKSDVGIALERAINRIDDQNTLELMANHLGVDTRRVRNATDAQFHERLLQKVALGQGIEVDEVQHRLNDQANYIKSLRREVRDRFLDQFESKHLQLAFAKTPPNEPLIDIEVYPNGDRFLFIDADLIDQWLVPLTDYDAPASAKALKQKDGVREEAENGLLLSVFFAAAAPEPIGEPGSLAHSYRFASRAYTINEQVRDDFLKDLDKIYDAVDASSPEPQAFTRQMTEFAAWRRDRELPYFIRATGEQRRLSGPGLQALISKLERDPNSFEIMDREGRRLPVWQFLVNTFQNEGVTARLAKLLSADHRLENVVRPKTNERIVFLAAINIFIVGATVAGFLYVQLFADVWHRLQLSQFFLTAFSLRGVTESPGYQRILFSIVLLFVSSLFIGMFAQTAQYVVAHVYWIPRLFTRLYRGSPAKAKRDFKRLTDFDPKQVLQFASTASPLSHDSELRAPLEKYSLMMVQRIEMALDRAPMSIKRRAVSALYLYARNPLHPRQPFFNDLPPLELPSNLDIMNTLGDSVRFQPQEIHWLLRDEQRPLIDAMARDLGLEHFDQSTFDHFSMADTERALDSLRRHGFPFEEGSPFKIADAHRRDRMEERRVELAIGKMSQSPMFALLALISRDLAGLAFDPVIARGSDGDESDLMAQTLEAYIHRLRTLAPGVYVSYREWSRYSLMGWQFYDLMEAINEPDPARAAARAADIEQAFSQVLSDIELDATNPEIQRLFLTPPQRRQVRLAQWAGLGLLQRLSPQMAKRVKRRLGIIRTIDDPEEQLELALLLKENLPREMTDLAVAALKSILDYRILKELLNDAGPLNEAKLAEIVESRTLHTYRKLSEQFGLDLHWYLREYVLAKGNPGQQRKLLHDYISQLRLAPGQQTGLVFMWSRGLLKTSRDEHEQLSARVAPAAGERESPATFPKFLELRLLQDEKAKPEPTVSIAGLDQLHDKGAAVIQQLIALRHPGPTGARMGPAPFGKRPIFQEAAGDPNLREALRDSQEDAMLTDGNVYHVAISRRRLRRFIYDVFIRIASRVLLPVADRIHPVFYEQIEHILKNRNREQAVIFVYPELRSLEILGDTQRNKNAIIAGVPNPFLTNFMKVMTFWTKMPTERQAFLDFVRGEHGDSAVRQLESDIEDLLFDYTSYKLQFKSISRRYETDARTGERIDNLDDEVPPRGYRTGWITYTDDLSGDGPSVGPQSPDAPNGGSGRATTPHWWNWRPSWARPRPSGAIRLRLASA
ncbi:MAG TPA: hypothetical protein VMU17_06455 [Elusimicrobiota bacterium]|nr:hypothetical protein [Elusimicrobiota bacterium]